MSDPFPFWESPNGAKYHRDYAKVSPYYGRPITLELDNYERFVFDLDILAKYSGMFAGLQAVPTPTLTITPRSSSTDLDRAPLTPVLGVGVLAVTLFLKMITPPEPGTWRATEQPQIRHPLPLAGMVGLVDLTRRWDVEKSVLLTLLYRRYKLHPMMEVALKLWEGKETEAKRMSIGILEKHGLSTWTELESRILETLDMDEPDHSRKAHPRIQSVFRKRSTFWPDILRKLIGQPLRGEQDDFGNRCQRPSCGVHRHFSGDWRRLKQLTATWVYATLREMEGASCAKMRRAMEPVFDEIMLRLGDDYCFVCHYRLKTHFVQVVRGSVNADSWPRSI